LLRRGREILGEKGGEIAECQFIRLEIALGANCGESFFESLEFGHDLLTSRDLWIATLISEPASNLADQGRELPIVGVDILTSQVGKELAESMAIIVEN